MPRRTFEDWQRERQQTPAPTDDHEPPPHETPGDVERKRRILDDGLQALRRLHGDQTWEDWMAVNEALRIITEDVLGDIAWDKDNKKQTAEITRRWEAYEARLGSNYKPISKQERWALRTVMTTPEIVVWRATLPGNLRRRLNHPNAVINKWKATTKPKVADEDKPLSTAEKLDQAKEQLKQMKDLVDDNRFKPGDTADQIADALVGMFTEHKADDIARRMLKKLAERKAKKKKKGAA